MFGNDRTLVEEHNSRRIFVVVWVGGVLGVPDVPYKMFGNDRTLVEDTKIE